MARPTKSISVCKDASVKTSVLIVTEDTEIAQRIQECLVSISNQHNSCLLIHLCSSIAELLSSGITCSPDFVAFIINSAQYQVLSIVEENMRKLSSAFFLDRLCLVVNTEHEGWPSRASDINSFRQQYQLHVLWGNANSQCSELCERLFNLVTAICGSFTGFPLLTHH